jgi:threonine aldolase
MIDIDLRSDTVTRPTEAMRRAIADADVGDDVYGEDPTVTRLERETAERLGKEAALFVPSGTMANQLAVLAQTSSGHELWCHESCHVVDGEQGGAAVLGRVQTRMFRGDDDGALSPDDLRPWLRDSSDPHSPYQTLIAVENTMGYRGGEIYPLARLEELRLFADSTGMRIHVDGARLWNAAVATGVALDVLAGPADTVSVCFSKSLGAPVGSALAGPADTIARARRGRKLLGGGMRQAGVVAAGALHALMHHVERLRDDHVRALRLGELIADAPGIGLDRMPVTNMVIARVPGGGAARAAAAICEAGVGCLAWDADRIRFVVHLGVSDDDIDNAAARILRALDPAAQRSPMAGAAT